MRLVAGLALACATDPLADSGESTGTDTGTPPTCVGCPADPWVMAYYALWSADALPVDEVPWAGMTDLALSFYAPGSMDLLYGDEALALALVDGAHAHGVRAVGSIGGAYSGVAFGAATAPAAIDGFVDAIVAAVDAHDLDGIDFDWEPLSAAEIPRLVDLAERVRDARPALRLTVPVGIANPNLGADFSAFGDLAPAVDGIDIMTYGMAGPWDGWKSWHSAPMSYVDPATPASVESSVAAYLDGGVPPEKLGFGVAGYGLCYEPPVTGPDQSLGGSDVFAVPFSDVLADYYRADAHRFDALAQVPYLTFAEPTGPLGCTYLSYEDEQSVAVKVDYLRSQGLGGLILWELTQTHLAAGADRDPIATALAAAIAP